MISGLFFSHTSLSKEAETVAGNLLSRSALLDGCDVLSAKKLDQAIDLLGLSETVRFVWLYHEKGLELFDRTLAVKIKADFFGPTVSYRLRNGGGFGQMIAKAVGAKGQLLRIIDATAGLGTDALVLASLGCEVRLLERQPAVRALLSDGIKQATRFAANKDERLMETLSRMELLHEPTLDELSEKDSWEPADVIYLDPMFPKKSKQARVKKEMQVLQALVGEDDDADRLLERALQCTPKRVVVKRPRVAPYLAGKTPSHSLLGKSNRFDVYIVH
jgi:16S rRNA (guanine1516-N2)-methyltransferase